jgi:hypothetical protein
VRPYLQNNQCKRVVAQAVEHLPHKHKVLNSTPVLKKKKKGRKVGRDGGREGKDFLPLL